MRDTPAARRWRSLVEEQAASGLTIKAFAEQKDVNAGTLAWWRSQLRPADAAPKLPSQAPTFTEVVVEPHEPKLVVVLDDFRAHVVVDRDTDLGLLRRVLKAVS